jgi:carboxylesterase type B
LKSDVNLPQITAYAGKGDPSFSQAILMSPGYFPILSDSQSNEMFDEFLDLTSASSLEDTKRNSSEELVLANAKQIYDAPYGSHLYGPSIDDDLVVDFPQMLLQRGDFHRNIKVLVGHTSDEGLLFTDIDAATTENYGLSLRSNLYNISTENVNYIANKLYPEKDFKNEAERQAQTISDLGFLCNAYALATVIKDARVYEFSRCPGLHGLDLGYAFYDGGKTSFTLNQVIEAASE